MGLAQSSDETVFDQSLKSCVEANDPAQLKSITDASPFLFPSIREKVNENMEGHTLLGMACELGHSKCVEVLLEIGADPNATNEDGWAPLALASFNNHVEIIQMLLNSGANVDIEGGGKTMSLHWACDKGHVRAAKALIDGGARVNAHDEMGNTALHYACQKGHDEVAMLLIESGVDYNIANQQGKKAIDVWENCSPSANPDGKHWLYLMMEVKSKGTG